MMMFQTFASGSFINLMKFETGRRCLGGFFCTQNPLIKLASACRLAKWDIYLKTQQDDEVPTDKSTYFIDFIFLCKPH